MKFKKFILSVSLSTLIVLETISGFNVSAYTWSGSREIDNNTSVPGYSNTDIQSVYLYKTGSNLFNGNANYTSTQISIIADGYDYYWNYPQLGSSVPQYFDITVGAYLNDAAFTDQGAMYFVHNWGDCYLYMSTINQNSAPSGWSYITVNNIESSMTPNHRGFSSYHCYVRRTKNNPKTTGADAVRVTFKY